MRDFKTYLDLVAVALENNSKRFEELDSAAGDGDLGITAGKIAGGIRAGSKSMTGDLKADLMGIGREISKSAPSTFGTLFATGFIRASTVVAAENDALTNLRKAIQAAFDGVSARGKAQLGERTLLDALHPALQALNEAKDLSSALPLAATAARAGAKSTAEMMPRHGRAGWIGERAKGLEDAGANVIAVVFEALD
ncbi:MAG: DAK2 domain-containing protein [Actinobacteria bacterium]|nr:DAK2 domain-containing protein [Actinomycetota bacterium]